MYRNFQEIVDKYPGMSKDLVMAMVSQGLTVNTPGIGKIVSLDGISQLKNDTSNLEKIKSTVKRDRGFVGALGDTFKEAIYDPFKGATRLTFAALRHPYDTLTAAVRDISSGRMPQLAYGKESTLVSLLKDTFGGGKDRAQDQGDHRGASVRSVCRHGSHFGGGKERHGIVFISLGFDLPVDGASSLN